MDWWGPRRTPLRHRRGDATFPASPAEQCPARAASLPRKTREPGAPERSLPGGTGALGGPDRPSHRRGFVALRGKCGLHPQAQHRGTVARGRFSDAGEMVLAIEEPSSPAAYAAPEHLQADLNTFADTLTAVGAHALVTEFIIPMRRQLAAFGFHSAALDVRQNSAFHEKALAQLLAAAGIPDGASFSEWEQRRSDNSWSASLPLPPLPGSGHVRGS